MRNRVSGETRFETRRGHHLVPSISRHGQAESAARPAVDGVRLLTQKPLALETSTPRVGTPRPSHGFRGTGSVSELWAFLLATGPSLMGLPARDEQDLPAWAFPGLLPARWYGPSCFLLAGSESRVPSHGFCVRVMGLPARDGSGLGLSGAAQTNRCC